MDMSPGDIVISKAGRDKSRYFIVIEKADENHVFIVDGDMRRTDKPKKKKIKHLQVVKNLHSLSNEIKIVKDKIDNSQKVSNAEIRRCIAALNGELKGVEHESDSRG